jgi:membrane-associated phospholipid phosphatase
VQSLSTFVALAMIAATFVRPSHRLLWTTAAILLATGVGLSRIYLGVHWATDVIAGWGAAALWVTALLWLVDRVRPLPSRDERGPASRRGRPQTRLAIRQRPGSRPVARGEPGDVGHD